MGQWRQPPLSFVVVVVVVEVEVEVEVDKVNSQSLI